MYVCVLDVNQEATIWYRGCVDDSKLGDLEIDECYNTTEIADEVLLFFVSHVLGPYIPFW